MDHATKLLRAEREKLVAAIQGWEQMTANERAEIVKNERQLTICRQELEQINDALKALSARK